MILPRVFAAALGVVDGVKECVGQVLEFGVDIPHVVGQLFFPKLIDRNEKTLYEVFQTGQLMLGDGG